MWKDAGDRRFSTLQRVEIAEIGPLERRLSHLCSFSTLQRVEIAEIYPLIVPLLR